MIDISDNFLYIHKEQVQIRDNHDLSNIIGLYHADVHQLFNRYTNLKIKFHGNGNENEDSCFIYTDPFDFSYSCYSSDFLVYPFLNWKSSHELQRDYNSNTRLYRQLRFFIDNSYHRASVICKLHRENNELYINYYINKKIVNSFVLNKKDYKGYIIRSILNKIICNNINYKCQNELNRILETLPNEHELHDQLPPTTFPNLNITLFNYQIQDIKWMNYIEQNILNENNLISYIYKPYVNIQLDKNAIDILTPCLNLDSQEPNFIYYCNELIPNIPNKNEFNLLKGFYKYFGGNLINSVGLGKTIITLCHILKTPNHFDKFVNFEDDELCNYFYKRGSNKGNTCSKKKLSKFYCKEHNTTPFIDKRKVYYHNLENFHIYEHIILAHDHYKLITNSNLIICPGHLSDQWTREYYNHFSDSASRNGKRVLLVITQDQFLNLTLGDILFSDIIITSYNFLNNKILQDNNRHSIDSLIKNSILSHENKYKLLNSKDSFINQFSNFKFNTIILDESHEIKNSNTKCMINKLSSKYKWNITGTPFANGVDGFFDIISYISKGENHNMGDKYVEMIKSSSELFRRNTKETIKNEVKKNLITYTTKLLTFTEQERNIYDSYLTGHADKNHNFLIKLCCHPEIDQETRNIIKNCKTFSEIQNALLDHNHLKITKSISIQKKLEFSIKLKEEEILNNNANDNANDNDNQYLESIKNDLSNDKRNLTNEKKNYDIVKRVYDYLKSVINNIKESETCPICLDDTNIDNLAITNCGHKFCWDCINEYIEEMDNRSYQVKCPKCNIAITKDDIYKYQDADLDVDTNLNIIDLNVDNDLTNLIHTLKSTKIGNIIHYINKELEKDDKCIIFSQWDEILNKIGDSLTQNHVYCKGSVYQKKKAIKNFSENSDTNIILLSSKNAASGTNLTAANKIILVEPVYGTDKYREDIENQSIGRSNRIGQKRPIEVIRFIIKDTIEELCLNSNLHQI